MVAGARAFSFGSGEVWGLHVGWSGNHRSYAERLPSGTIELDGHDDAILESCVGSAHVTAGGHVHVRAG